MTSLEKHIKTLHNDFFFKEYTYSSTQFAPAGSSQVELADNIVWLDDIFFIMQMKERAGDAPGNEIDLQKWFKKKVLDAAVSQIKNTLQYLSTQQQITISNDQTHKFNLVDAPLDKAKKIIVYHDGNKNLPDAERRRKFYYSQSAGAIHLFHVEDYSWICNYLVTPCEIRDYLDFREELCRRLPELDRYPEQYVLGHFFAGTVNDSITPRFINSLRQIVDNREEYDLSHLINIFGERLINVGSGMALNYYFIQKELAKLARNELKEFKIRLTLAVEKVKADEDVLPYRIAIPRTGCAFIIIPLKKEYGAHWVNVLNNYTFAYKYEVRANKCIGLVIFQDEKHGGLLEAYWQLDTEPWEYDEGIEASLKQNYPFRKVTQGVKYRYFLRDEE